MRQYLSITLTLGCALVLSGCLSKEVSFAIDNPTESQLIVKIDQTSYSIAPYTEQKIKLPPGLHTLEASETGKVDFRVDAVANGDAWNDFFTQKRPTHLINPTLSPYIRVTETYFSEDFDIKKTHGYVARGINATVELDGVQFKGPFERIDGLFILKNWDFGVHKKFAQLINADVTAGSLTQTKLFSPQQFVSYFESKAETPGYYAKNKRSTPELKTKPTPFAANFPTLSDPALQSIVEEMKTIHHNYMQAQTTREQEKIRALFSAAVLKMISAYAPKSSKLSKEEREKIEYINFKISASLYEPAKIMAHRS